MCVRCFASYSLFWGLGQLFWVFAACFAMAAGKSVLKASAVKWNEIRKALRQQCHLARVPVVRTKSAAVRAGVLQPPRAEAQVLLPINYNRNPIGLKKKALEVVCRFCFIPRSEAPWRRDGSGQICKLCATARRKENRKHRALKAKAAAEANAGPK